MAASLEHYEARHGCSVPGVKPSLPRGGHNGGVGAGGRRDGGLEGWDPDPDELAEVGYEEDGIMWLTVTPRTATAEQALVVFAKGRPYRRTWRVAGRRDFWVDASANVGEGE